MIPGYKTSKYKYLSRIQIDIWNTLKYKQLKRKKWRPLRSRLKKQKDVAPLLGYKVRPLSSFPVYYKYFYQNTLYLKQGLKLFYGSLQDYRIKAIVRQGNIRGSSQGAVLREFDERVESFLYNLKIASTISQARQYSSYQDVLINKSNTKNKVKKGDIVNFTGRIKALFCQGLKRKKLKFLPFEIDFDPQSIRFCVIKEKQIFTHPFMHKFSRVIRWYSL